MKKFGPIVLSIVIAALITLTACRRDEAPAASPPAPTPAVIISTNVPVTAPATTEVIPTVTVEPTNVPTAYPVIESVPTQEVCLYAYFFEPAPERCPGAESRVSQAAEQPFENGTMLWLGEEKLIIILNADFTWQGYDDTWTEEQPVDNPSLSPPSNRYQPIRGFGKIWRELPGIQQRLGWALSPELGFESTIQDQAGGDGNPDITFVRLFNGQVATLTRRGSDRGDWVIASSP